MHTFKKRLQIPKGRPEAVYRLTVERELLTIPDFDVDDGIFSQP
jgi:hypothetical protein